MKSREKVNVFLRYVQKVRQHFVIDISLQPLKQFQQVKSHFKEHLKLYLWCKNEGDSSRNKRDMHVTILCTFFRKIFYTCKNHCTACLVSFLSCIIHSRE